MGLAFSPFAIFSIPLLAKRVKDETRDDPTGTPTGIAGFFSVLNAQEQAAQEEQDRALEELLRLQLLARPAAQLTREPVPVVVAPPPPAPLVVPETAPQPTREPVPVVIEEEEPVAFSINDLTGFLGDLGGLISSGSDIVNVINPSAAPSVATAGLLPQVIGAGVGAVGGSIVTSLFGNGNGNGVTPLQQISANFGKRVSRKQVITAAKVCGLDQAAQTFRSDVRLICEVVSKGMPRRGRGISSADLRRTRSTIRKISTMQRSLKPLCATTRRR